MFRSLGSVVAGLDRVVQRLLAVVELMLEVG